ncbi:MAG: hypothetical protein Q7S80_01265 [bacterium]|nr:hypothetical protein [bacterium]
MASAAHAFMREHDLLPTVCQGGSQLLRERLSVRPDLPELVSRLLLPGWEKLYTQQARTG